MCISEEEERADMEGILFGSSVVRQVELLFPSVQPCRLNVHRGQVLFSREGSSSYKMDSLCHRG